ncbi:MAG: pilus assembly protein [Gammaproteobacteria bacterium]|jgi:type IV pilus assembly protein PilY1|nr:pilus assembly protein [Gammaproteobacteria bacterium]
MKRATLSILCLLGAIAPQGQCALLNLPQSPIPLTTPVPPNIMFDLDDSGSMDWEYISKPSWEGCAYDPNFTGAFSASTVCGSQWSGDAGFRSYANGQFWNFNYIFHNSTNIYNYANPTGCGYTSSSIGLNAVEACPQAGTKDWRFFTSGQNSMYYNPDSTYDPWIYNCSSGTPCANANFSAALAYPVSGEAGYTNARNLAGLKYEVWIDDKGFSGTRPLRGGALNVTNTANGDVDLWDSHVTVVLNASDVQVYLTTYAPTAAGMNPTTTLQTTLTGGGCYDVLGTNDLVRSIAAGTLSWTAQDDSGCMTISEAKQNFANWYQYARRRSMAARGTIAFIINQYPNFNYGINTINDNFFIQVPPSGTTNFTTYNTAILDTLMKYNWQAQGTPTRSGLSRVGQYYKNALTGKTNPITASCQQNYAILLTDGYWNTGDSLPSGISDNDGDGISDTLADTAYYYYKNNLQTTWPANQVIPSVWDPATWLHMVTFTVGYGLAGNLDAGSDGWPSPALAINGNWGNPFNSDAAKADDLWHAAFNSKGNYVAAQSPTTAAKSLSAILANIAQRNASYSSVAQNSTVLNAQSAVYQATVNGNQGDVEAFPLSITGVLSTTPIWSANCMLTGGPCLNPVGTNAVPSPNSRVVITRNWTGANTGIAFRWPSNYSSYKVSGSLPTNMANFLANAPYPANTTTGSQITANQNYGAALVNFLRGVRTQEAQYNGSYAFRNRASLLGDIVDSSPVYVPAPNRNYPDSLEASSYSAFKTTYANRTPIIYVGANDGMLHGFNANTGKEVLSYIPGVRQIYQNLPNLSLSTYAHNFFVDGTPTEADIYYGGAWHTILAGSLRNGGQGVYGLDITNPANFTEANANNLYLWEFTDQNDPDLGYIEGNISIAKVRTASNQSQWAIIFGNGYNNSQADGFASTTGKAALYILIPALFNGTWTLNQNYYKIPVGTGSVTTPNGLSSPYVVDINNDYIVDYVYAGDLKGNMWKFNLTSTTPADWQTANNILFTANFASAGDQPITSQPIVGAHPNGLQYGVIVYFGTGQYLQPTDNSTTGQVTQSFYAIWDKLSGTTTVTKGQLLQQTILGQAAGATGNYRLVTSTPINWTTTGTQNLGWYMNLVESAASSNNGERVISQPVLRNNNVVFSTLIPSSNACAPGGSSWLMELDSASGGTPNASPFDVNNDGIFSTADYLTLTISGTKYTQAAAGVQSSVGMTGTPAVFLSPDKQSETKVLSGSQGLGTVTENPGTGPAGRQNWRQLY